ncbi:Sec-independent protein translocase protein TatB [Corynebacterium deserti GIMN1.010]|uniref:Sec-independent protein translocase protein TatB n=1 Tax=Corynebacterium deserti GIMN1.010 TaxID=931089 RepID=A0A0M3Q9F2_9CORY|nr:Sec-independent protein translocase subunit TatB [Corynebacterium deserti]ALC05523.1 Sec-independent protein translocase protein TatB [Corynebacterium deserti GIMN1.010]
MFSSVGWGEIFLLVVVGLVVIGPERLPRLIQDARAALLAARTAIDNAKQTLNDDFGSEFDEIRKPLSQVAQYSRMSPKTALTKALFDGDSNFLDDFDPKKIMAQDTEGQAQRTNQAPENNANVVERPEAQKNDPKDGPNYSGGVSWTDII